MIRSLSNNKKYIALGALVLVLALIYRHLKEKKRLRKLKLATLFKNLENKRKMRDILFDQQKNKLPIVDPDKKTNILESDISGLQKLLQSHTITSEEILLVYFEKVSTKGRQLNLITEVMFGRALESAKRCDRQRLENPKECKGFLHGIPFSLEDCFFVKGFDSTCGNPSRCFQPSNDDSFIIKLFEQQGAFPFVKSNISPELNAKETCNSIWGRSKNPLNDSFSPGLGEAGLVAAGCSAFGVTVDNIGYTTHSTLSCGLVGFRPTGGRLLNPGYDKEYCLHRDRKYFKSTFGLVGKSVEDINLIMKSLLNNPLYDNQENFLLCPNYVRKEWNENKVFLEDKLRIGYVKDFKLFPASLANKRAVIEAITLLGNDKYATVEMDFSDLEPYFKLVQKLILEKTEIEGQTHNKDFKNKVNKYKIVFRRLLGLPKSRKSVRRAIPNPEIEKEISKAEIKFFQIWKEKNVDVLILPGSALPGNKHGYSSYITGEEFYSTSFELFNCPAGTIPITQVKTEEEEYSVPSLNSKALQNNLKGMAGLPVGIKVIAPPWEDERCLSVLLKIQGNIKANLTS